MLVKYVLNVLVVRLLLTFYLVVGDGVVFVVGI